MLMNPTGSKKREVRGQQTSDEKVCKDQAPVVQNRTEKDQEWWIWRQTKNT